MTNKPPGDWNRCLDQHQYIGSYLNELYFPMHFESEHSSRATFGDKFLFPASQAHCFRHRPRTDGHSLELDEIER